MCGELLILLENQQFATDTFSGVFAWKTPLLPHPHAGSLPHGYAHPDELTGLFLWPSVTARATISQ